MFIFISISQIVIVMTNNQLELKNNSDKRCIILYFYEKKLDNFRCEETLLCNEVSLNGSNFGPIHIKSSEKIDNIANFVSFK